MSVHQCPICNTYLDDQNSPCPECLFINNMSEDDLIELISDHSRDYQGKINQTIRLIRLISMLSVAAFIELKADLLYEAVFNYSKAYERLPDWKEEQLELVKCLPAYLGRDSYYTNTSVVSEVVETAQDSPERRERIKERSNKEKSLSSLRKKKPKVRLISDNRLNLYLDEDPDYDGYYDTVLPIDHDQVKSSKKQNEFDIRRLGLTGLLSFLIIIAVTAFTVPFIV